MLNITTYEQKINSCVCNCGRLTDWYPERGYVEFWLQEPDGKYLLRDIEELNSETPYDAIERHIDDGVLGYQGQAFDDAPVLFIVGGQV